MATSTGEKRFTLGEVADLCGTQAWRVRRLFERGLVADCERVGRQRVVKESELPAIRKALADAGYLKKKKSAQ